jgi:hypothetical protein
MSYRKYVLSCSHCITKSEQTCSLTCTLLTVSALKMCFTVEKSERKMELALMMMMVWQVW